MYTRLFGTHDWSIPPTANPIESARGLHAPSVELVASIPGKTITGEPATASVLTNERAVVQQFAHGTHLSLLGNVDVSSVWVAATQAAAIIELVLVALVLIALTFLIAVRVIDTIGDGEIEAIEQSLPIDLAGAGGAGSANSDQSTLLTDAVTTPPEFLTDEEYVLQLLAANDGQMQQNQIVEQSDWSKSKVSRLLSKMDDNGQIEKRSIGRENLITLPGENLSDVREIG